jgi:hypothetical protein
MHRHVLFIFAFCLSALSLFSQSLDLSVTPYDQHIELNWTPTPSADRYEILRKSPGEKTYTVITATRQLRLQDWTGRSEPVSGPYNYFIRALNVPGAVIDASDTLQASVYEMSDDEFLDMTQQYTFRYFWEYAHPVSGMARERLGSDDVVTTGGSGFGIMAIIVGVHRGYITREQAVNRLLQIVSFLQFADRFHGAFPHWMNGDNGSALAFSTFDNGGDLVETAFLMEGLLAARSYFDGDNESEIVLREVITSLWEDVEWDHYSRNNSGVLYWHWSPDFGWQMNFQIRGWNEAMIVYILAIASPTHAVPATYYHTGWAGGNYTNGNTWYGYKLFVGPPLGGPLFFAHYSFMGFDPREKKDAYANYFKQNTNHTLINRAWCIDNPLAFEGYGENSWGLTASDDPWGYEAHAPGGTTDNGTLTPAAAIPSMPYTPNESIEVLKHFYREYGENLWGNFGFYDAFNPEENWFADSYIAIDQGPIINMIENYRSQLLWDAFMANPEIQPALDAIGFVPDPVATNDPAVNNISWEIFPTVTDDELHVIIHDDTQWNIRLVDMLGRNVDAAIEERDENGENSFLIHDIESHGPMMISIYNKNHRYDSRLVAVQGL